MSPAPLRLVRPPALERTALDGTALERTARDRTGRDRTALDRSEGDRPPTRDAAIERAKAVLHDELAAPWTVQKLGRRVGMSRPVLARRFRDATGVSPMRYLAELRLERAARRLRESERTLAEVALEVGYRSEFAFNRAFKRRFGVPPGTFRKAGTFAPTMRLAA